MQDEKARKQAGERTGNPLGSDRKDMLSHEENVTAKEIIHGL